MAHFSCVGATESCATSCATSRRRASRTCWPCAATRPRARASGAPPRRPALLDRADRADPRAVRLHRRRGRASPRCTPRRRAWSPTSRFAQEKQDAGASFLITQLFYRQRALLRLRRRRARAAGIDVPIIPGIMPVTTVTQIKRDHRAVRRHHPLSSSASWRRGRTTRRPCTTSALRTRRCSALISWLAGRRDPLLHAEPSPATRAILAALRAAQPWTRVKEAV